VHPLNSQPVLSEQEAERLRELEATIAEGMDSFLKIGKAFAEIRFFKLHRATHTNFEDYCRARWGLSLSRCNQIHRTIEVYDNIVAEVPQDAGLLAETNEHTLRPLSHLEPALQSAAWELVRHLEERPSGKTIEETVSVIKEAIASGWRERGTAEKGTRPPAAASESRGHGRNGTTSQGTSHQRSSDQLGNLCRWCNRVTTWDPEAIALADDELRLKAHLKAVRQLRTFCETFIQALETRLSS
jgi:hypothetical protein